MKGQDRLPVPCSLSNNLFKFDMFNSNFSSAAKAKEEYRTGVHASTSIFCCALSLMAHVPVRFSMPRKLRMQVRTVLE